MAVVHVTTSAAILFAQAAARMSRWALRLDDPKNFAEIAESERADHAAQLLDTSLSAVISAYTHVEATINELYLDTTLFGRQHAFPGITDTVAARLSGAWNSGAEKLNPVEKIGLALVLADHTSDIDWGQGHAQDFALLHDLRNTLIHHKPKTVQHGKESANSDDKIERRLHTKFPSARIWDGKGVTFRWNGCLGGGCAVWAAKTAEGLVAEVCGALGTDYPSRPYR